jgi:hypothetical protein
MGEWPTAVLANLGLLAIYGLGSFFLALRLTERRFGIR